jgi:hypothetical protein
MPTITIYDLAGVIGSAVVILAYFGTQSGRLRLDGWEFPLANLVGAVFIMVSLVADWNLAAFVMEVFWILISLYGIARRFNR